MACPFASERVAAWVQGEEEDAIAAQQIATHVDSCATCRQLADDYRAIFDALRTVALPAATAPAPPAPQTIGRYRVIRRIGAGGMGVVYEAEQAEPARRVALKVIRSSHDVDDVQRRLFAREVQMLARLNHPNIAAVYDAGRTAEGEPYFVMEFVDGPDLLQAVAGPPPATFRERVRLLWTIARAMSHAHERGIIHRDLKPGNILISRNSAGGTPTPKILDFGLARALEAEAPNDRTTLPGVMLGTLGYMSPEQARGDLDAIDIRSDVYSLGVIFYELLCGALPLNLSADALHRAAQRIEQESPPDPRTHNPAVPRDVAVIALKCLEKSPARRYGSATELALELERYLGGHPIAARPASTLYIAGRFLARNTLASTLSLLLVAALAVGGITAAIQARRIALERDRVQEEATNVAKLNSVLESLLQSVDPWKAGDREARVLDVIRAISHRTEAELADTPLLAAAVRNTLGNTWRSLGGIQDYAESERHLQFALETRRRLLPAPHPDIATSANDLGETHYWMGNSERAAALFAEAVELRRGSLRPDHPQLAESLNNLGSALKQLGDLDKADQHYREALSIRNAHYQRSLTDGGAATRDRASAAEDVAETRNNRGASLRSLSQQARAAGDSDRAARLLADATTEYRAALELRRVWLGDVHPSTATSFNNLGRALQDAGKFGEAETCLRESLRILHAGLGDRHQLIGRALHNLARLRGEMGDSRDAASLAAQALEMRSALLGDDHRETRESAELLRSLPSAAPP